MRQRRHRRRRWSELSGSLWLLPSIFTALALVAGWTLSLVEVSDDSLLSEAVFRGSAADARQLLIVVSGTMITVTGLVFVLTVIPFKSPPASSRRGFCGRSSKTEEHSWYWPRSSRPSLTA